MLRPLCLPLALGFTIIAPQFAMAQAPSAQIPSATPDRQNHATPRTCQNKRDTITGNVTAVQGDRITLQLENGASQSIALPAASGGQFSNLVGQRIIVNRTICYPEQTIPTPPIPQKW